MALGTGVALRTCAPAILDGRDGFAAGAPAPASDGIGIHPRLPATGRRFCSRHFGTGGTPPGALGDESATTERVWGRRQAPRSEAGRPLEVTTPIMLHVEPQAPKRRKWLWRMLWAMLAPLAATAA